MAIPHSSHFGGVVGGCLLDTHLQVASVVALQSWMGSNQPSSSIGAVVFGSSLSNARGIFNLGGKGFHVFWSSLSHTMVSLGPFRL